MRLNRNTGLAALLIGLGVMVLLNQLGVNVFSWLVPIALVGLGYYGIRQGRSTIGWVVLIIGLLGLMGKLWGLIALLLPIVLIWYGWTLLKRRDGNIYQ